MSGRILISTVAVLAAAIVVLAAPGRAGAATASNFHPVTYGGDTWLNYDVTAVGSSSVDWPVDIVFWGNATISKVQRGIGWIWGGSSEHEQVNDGAGSVWVATGGRKNTFCTDTHYRAYADADGFLTSPLLGNYVIVTSHLDRNECGSSATFGFNETAEANVAARAATAWGSAAVQRNALVMPDGVTSTFGLFDNANTQTQGNHSFNNDGYPTLVRVP